MNQMTNPNSDPTTIESQLDELGASLRSDASLPPAGFLQAVAHRRHARRAAQLGTVAAALALVAGAFFAGRVSAPPETPGRAPRVVHAPGVRQPTLASLRTLDPEGVFEPGRTELDSWGDGGDELPLRMIDRPDSARARAVLSFN